VLLVMCTCSGRSFRALGATTLKARSPNFKCVLSTCKSDLVADCKMVQRSDSAETGWKRFDMYNRASPVPLMAEWINKHRLVCTNDSDDADEPVERDRMVSGDVRLTTRRFLSECWHHPAERYKPPRNRRPSNQTNIHSFSVTTIKITG